MYRYFIELVQIFHQLGAWQKRGLALWCCGVLLAESCQLSRVADALLAEKRGTAAALNKRLSRFLGNPRINDAGLLEVWIGWIVRCYGGEHWSILVDETKLSHHVSVMMVGLAYRGRAIPLLWRCYHPQQYPPDEKEPWCLVTNCAHRTSADYAQRAWHEHSFRDLKSFGFNWQLSHVWQPHRLQRLLLILAISYSWILSQAVLYTPCERISPSRTAPRESLFRRGLRWFRQLKVSPQPREVYPDLYFCPDTPLRC